MNVMTNSSRPVFMYKRVIRGILYMSINISGIGQLYQHIFALPHCYARRKMGSRAESKVTLGEIEARLQ